MSLEMAHKVIVPQKKIMSRSFLNSGTLIVIAVHQLCVWVMILADFRPNAGAVGGTIAQPSLYNNNSLVRTTDKHIFKRFSLTK
jgi:hypothetical protein